MVELKNKYKKILIVKPSALGDIVHSLAFLNALKGQFPDAGIDWVVAYAHNNLLEGHPMINKLWVINKHQWKKISKAHETLGELKTFFRALRKEKYDLVVDLQGLLRSGLITAATGAKYRVGFQEAREGSTVFYTHKVKGGKDIHAVDRYLKIASFLGCDTGRTIFPFPIFSVEKEMLRSLPEVYAVIVPSAGKQANRWPAERFGELASRLPLKCVVVGSGADEGIVGEVVKNSKGNAISLAGKTDIKGLTAVIKRARFLISNDTGPMHIAAAFDVKVFAIFGPANPVRTGPYGSMHTVIREDLPCSPCYAKKKCRDWKCINMITVDRVYSVINKEIDRLVT